jgi:hypothetical protein
MFLKRIPLGSNVKNEVLVNVEYISTDRTAEPSRNRFQWPHCLVPLHSVIKRLSTQTSSTCQWQETKQGISPRRREKQRIKQMRTQGRWHPATEPKQVKANHQRNLNFTNFSARTEDWEVRRILKLEAFLHTTQGPVKIGHYTTRQCDGKYKNGKQNTQGKKASSVPSPWRWAVAARARGRRASTAACCRLGFCDARKKAAGNSVASREVASREAAPRLGSLTAQNQRDSVIRVSHQRVTPLIPETFLVSVKLFQPIPIMRFMVSTDLIQQIQKIFCIGWVTSVDTNKPQLINTAHTPLFRLSTTVAVATVPIEISFLRYFFNFL